MLQDGGSVECARTTMRFLTVFKTPLFYCKTKGYFTEHTFNRVSVLQMGVTLPARTEISLAAAMMCKLQLYIHIYLLTYWLHGEDAFLGTYGYSARQEIPRILCNRKVHYRIHNSPPPIPITSHIDPVHAPIPLLKDPF